MSNETKTCPCAHCNNPNCQCGGQREKTPGGCCCGQSCQCGSACQCPPSCGCPATATKR
ncbi:MAG: hypothetical protein QM820_08545 [Minicystis sp.]